MTQSHPEILTEIEAGLQAIPLIDVHTHIDAAHLSARGLHDILLYHMVISDLYSAGCPSGARLSEDPDNAEVESRIIEALPYLKHIQNTSIFWGVRTTLRDLYGWEEPLTTANWRRLDARIRERAGDPSWPLTILKRAGIHRQVTELWRGRDGSANDLFQYSLEWAFFARAQWGQNDIPLFELEKAWNEQIPSPPLPVTLSQRPSLEQTIHSVEDVQAALHHYCEHIPFNQIISTAQHISTDIQYRSITDEEMANAINNHPHAGEAERDIYASYLLEHFLTELEKHADQIVFQFSLGAEPLPYESGSKLRQETVYHVAEIIAHHPQLRFQVLLSSAHANQALCTLARELPNLSLAGYWWHNFFPTIIRQVMSERLDMLPINKQICFFSDAYCVDWAYVKAVMVRKQLAEVLATRVVEGQHKLDEAMAVARGILYESPQTLLGLKPSPALM